MRARSGWALALIAAVVAGGCGGGEAKTGGPGTYTADGEGAKVTLTIPATGSAIDGPEQYRVRVGGDAVAWGLLRLDNADGEREVGIGVVTAVTRDGEQIELASAPERVSEWRDLIDINADGDLYNEGVELHNAMLNADEALPGAKTELPLVFDGDPEQIEKLFVTIGSEENPFGDRVQMELE